jgi:hypothetical protein
MKVLPVSFCSLVLSLSAFAGSAQAAHYDGPAVDVNFNNQKPAKYAECDKYLSDKTPRRYAACEFGRDEAERMAERFGGGNGRIIGYLRGYSWGLNKMANLTDDDATEMAAGAAAVDGMGQYMQSGIDAGKRDGQSQGTSRGRSDAIDRFSSVLDTGRDPNPTLAVPQVSYSGVQNGYEKYVGAVPTTESIIKNEVAPQLGQLRVYGDWDALYLGDMQQASLWDLWMTNGTYTFEKEKWYDGNLGITTWLQRPIDTRPKYDNLNNPPLYESDVTGIVPPPPAPVTPVAPGTPGAQPAQPAQPGQPGQVVEQPPQPPQPKEVDLKAVFQDSFRNSYAYYVNYYFAKNFTENVDMGQMDGEITGAQIGKRVAHYKGLVAAFNKKFEESSVSSFYDSFTQSYTSKFQSTFSEYLNNPQLSVQLLDIIGAEDDGILQPGETFSAKFKVVNMGGVGTPLTASVSGNVEGAEPRSFSIPRLKTQVYTADAIAKIDPRMQPRQSARISLNVNGVSSSMDELIQQMIEVANVSSRVDTINGSGEIYVTLRNIATVRTPGVISAMLLFNGQKATVQQVGFVQPGESIDVALPFSGVDPLKLMVENLDARITITMNDHQLDAAQTTITSKNPTGDLMRYYGALVNGKGYVPREVNQADQLATAKYRILKKNEDEVTDNRKVFGPNPWKNDSSSTIVGMLVDQFRSSSQNESVQAAYDDMAKAMWPARKDFRKVIFFWKSGKRKAYEKLVQQLTRTKLK